LGDRGQWYRGGAERQLQLRLIELLGMFRISERAIKDLDDLRRAKLAITRRSPSRNARSPRLAKISSMVSPAAASISGSESKKGKPSLTARRRPILLFPAPIKPTKAIVRLGVNRRFSAVFRSDRMVSICTRRSPPFFADC
jgi:hypothetical protein